MKGRPRKELNKAQLSSLAAIGCTQREIAQYFGVSEKTVERRLEEEAYRQAFDRGEGEFKVSLRRLMVRRAQEGNTAMLIFLAKNVLGMADQPRTTNPWEGQVLPWCDD